MKFERFGHGKSFAGLYLLRLAECTNGVGRAHRIVSYFRKFSATLFPASAAVDAYI